MHSDEKVLNILLDQLRVTNEQVDAARENHPDKTAVEALCADGTIQTRDIDEAVAIDAGLSYCDLTDEAIVEQVRQMIAEIKANPNEDEKVGNLLRAYKVLPLRHTDHGLQLVTCDAENFDLHDTLPRLLEQQVEFLYAGKEHMEPLVEELYHRREHDKATDNSKYVEVLVEDFLREAQKTKASDIHLEPVEDGFRIRFRIDGELEVYKVIPNSEMSNLAGSVVSRLKIMTETMSIDEKRIPQDGRIKHPLTTANGSPLIDKNGKRQVLDLRVSTIPTSQGESVVMRLLDQSTLSITLPDLGFMSDDQEYFRGLIKLADGIILVTGPTGSGKTTTLYACLSEINDESRKIITAEDPIEYVMPGVNQVHVKADIGMTFARALRSMLRQAPNVVMIGEIRDLETAGIAINASLTGHLVLSTLHTNDAPSAIARLIDIGVKPFLVSSAVRAVMAQRLCRKLCSECKDLTSLSESEMTALKLDPEQLADAKIYKPKGCSKCRGTGYKGRLGIFEIFKLDDEMRQMINRMGDGYERSEQVSTVQLRKRARQQGMRTLREDGFQKVFAGLTTFDEVLAVTMGDSD